MMVFVLTAIPVLSGCGQAKSDTKTEDAVSKKEETEEEKQNQTAPEISGLTYEKMLSLEYAEGFDVFYYKDGYVLLDVHDSSKYLAVPEGKEAPEGLDEEIVVVPKAADTIYLAATSAMALFDSLGCMDSQCRYAPLRIESLHYT